MSLIPVLSTDYILSHIDEAQIFSAYLQDKVSLKQKYSSPFRRDQNPSCSFYYNKTGKLRFKDFGNNETLDCFDFVAKKYQLSLRESLNRIACDFGLVKCNSAPFKDTVLKQTEHAVEKVKKETIIEYERGQWTLRDLEYWWQYCITREELDANHVAPVHKLRINGKSLPNWRKELRFGYDINVRGKTYTKLYTPHADKNHFKWISNIPLHIPFGINTLPRESNVLIVTKSLKEKIIWNKFFTDVIAIQAENRSALNEKTVAFIEKQYDRVFVAFDLDETGIECAHRFAADLGYNPVFTPEKAKKTKGVKDFAEFVESYGLDMLTKYLQHLNLIN